MKVRYITHFLKKVLVGQTSLYFELAFHCLESWTKESIVKRFDGFMYKTGMFVIVDWYRSLRENKIFTWDVGISAYAKHLLHI